MTWSQAGVDSATAEYTALEKQYNDAMTRWQTDLQVGATTATASKQAVDRALASWKQYMYQLMDSTQSMTSDTVSADSVSQLAMELGATKAELASLQSKAGTRIDQADSVNPKIRQSPYTNILGLRRMFRPSTRFAIMIASIVFGVLSVATLGFLGYQVAVTGTVINPSFITPAQTGGGRRS